MTHWGGGEYRIYFIGGPMGNKFNTGANGFFDGYLSLIDYKAGNVGSPPDHWTSTSVSTLRIFGGWWADAGDNDGIFTLAPRAIDSHYSSEGSLTNRYHNPWSTEPQIFVLGGTTLTTWIINGLGIFDSCTVAIRTGDSSRIVIHLVPI